MSESNWEICRWAMEKCDHMQRRITCRGLDAGFYIYFSWGRGGWFDRNDLSYFPDFNRGRWLKWESKQEPEYKCEDCRDRGHFIIKSYDQEIKLNCPMCSKQEKQEPKTVTMWQPVCEDLYSTRWLYKSKSAFRSVSAVIGWIKHEVELVDSEGE
jgi:ssDNA-binding Zn-finger/Zn-ribbon topoisomerase 1